MQKPRKLSKGSYPPKIESGWFDSPDELLKLARKKLNEPQRPTPDTDAEPTGDEQQPETIEATRNTTTDVTVETFKNTGITDLYVDWRGRRSRYCTAKKKYMKRQDESGPKRRKRFHCVLHSLQEMLAGAQDPSAPPPTQDAQALGDAVLVAGFETHAQIDGHACWAAASQMIRGYYNAGPRRT